ncbi:hypothetical protein OG897_32230 [Streptomyces sp. NBC_00237]|uniref:hypothetical protein n=1 Tax=Streptomyces sp. NBC_00237 TaxID=2975687 RepID=UPI00224D0442|nr:hypothetical protein [Streptomyces sp. NBC_00237]MCX5206071.1 hypothetical protein [Streptomyces sp. NBC_00237]
MTRTPADTPTAAVFDARRYAAQRHPLMQYLMPTTRRLQHWATVLAKIANDPSVLVLAAQTVPSRVPDAVTYMVQLADAVEQLMPPTDGRV